MNLRHIVLLAALALLPVAATVDARTYALSGDDVAIWNPAGAIRMEAASGSSVEIEVTLAGRDAGKLSVNDQALSGRPTLRVLYPDHRIVYPAMGRWSNSSTSIKSDGTWGKSPGSSSMGQLFGQRITVKGSGSGTEAWADLVVRIPRGHKVSVYSLVGAGQIENVDGQLLFDGGSGGVQVSKSRGELTIDIGSGAVQVAGFEGKLDIDTGSGSVRASGVQGPSVRIDTGSGGVAGDHITTDDLLVDTGSGSVELALVDAKRAKIDTGSGSVELAMLTRSPDLDIDTGSGSVRVSVPADFSARLHLETGSGGISSELPVTVEEKDHGMLRGSVGGGTGRLHVDTGSGRVSLLSAIASPGATTRTKSR